MPNVAKRVFRSQWFRRPARHALAAGLRVIAATGERGTEVATALSCRWLPQRICNDAPRVRVRRRGFDLELQLADNLQRVLFYTGWYERPYLNWLEEALRPGDVYVDVGGHVGIDALVAARTLERHGDGRVIVFEPGPDSAAKILAAARANGLEHRIEVQQLALGRQAGTIELRSHALAEHDAGMRSVFADGPVVAVAPVEPFDDWSAGAGLPRMDVVKIDVEGSEHDVLEGMRESIRRLRPRSVVVEITPSCLAQAGHDAGDIDAVLADCGYSRSGVVHLENVVYEPGGA
jgi:FkbM family methyltransferase